MSRFFIVRSFSDWQDGGLYGIFMCNVLGGLLSGFIASLVSAQIIDREEVRLFLLTGVLGGFTTFSAFSYDAMMLLQEQRFLSFVIYVGGCLLLSLCMVWLGMLIGHNLLKLT